MAIALAKVFFDATPNGTTTCVGTGTSAGGLCPGNRRRGCGFGPTAKDGDADSARRSGCNRVFLHTPTRFAGRFDGVDIDGASTACLGCYGGWGTELQLG